MEALADALGILSLVVGPALVVIGGGLSRAGEGLLAHCGSRSVSGSPSSIPPT